MSQPLTGERTWIDEAADRFESDWKQGGDRPRIEDFLVQEDGPRRSLLLQELLRVERELRKGAGETPGPQEYRQRFPDDRAAVDAVFGDDVPVGPPAKPRTDAAQSLLFGLLALQNNFIDRDALLGAFHAWVADKSQSLGQILLGRGALSPARHAVLQVLVQEHLQQHDQDHERSLAVLRVVPSVRDDLDDIPDFDLQASLLYLRLADSDGNDAHADSTADWDQDSAATDAEGRFRIVRFHDKGALGDVFVARDQQLHRIVALKRIKLDHATDRDKRARFVVEAEITGRLEHPGIVPVYGLGAYEDGRPFYAMRFIRGDNLKSAIEQFHRAEEKSRDSGERTLALLKLLRRYLDVCNAIDYAHSRGVLHRDLKPGNIMLGKYGETLVVDWGLAKSVGRSENAPASVTMDERTLVPQSGSDLRGTELGARLGTPAYMSPEQAAGRIDGLGPASDVYSLGATLYCLLTGRAPFNDPDLAELLRKVEHGDFPPPRKLKGWVDPALEAICLKAMATDPDERYRTPRALADDVEHWLADEPVTAWREPVSRQLKRWGRRHRLLVTSLGVTLIVAVAALAIGNLVVAQQRDRAEQSLAFARRVVDEMYTGVADKLENEKQMDDYQREILEKALVFYERFALPQSRDPRVRLEAAQAAIRVGGIRSKLGKKDAAEGAYQQALGILSGLVSDHPAEPVYRDALAQVHQELGAVFLAEERMPETEREYREAVAIWSALAREEPNTAGFRLHLARAHADLGLLYFSQMPVPMEEVNAEYLQALETADRLARENPDPPAYQETLVEILLHYASLQGNQHNLAGSRISRERALTIMEKLARNHPEVTKYQFGLGRCFDCLANILGVERKFHQAEEAQKRAIVIFENLAIDHPQDVEIAYLLGQNYANMANTYLLKGDQQSSLEWRSRAITEFRSLTHRDPRNVLRGRTRLGMSLAGQAESCMRLGRNAEALALYEEVIGLYDGHKAQELMKAFHALTKARLGDLSALAVLGSQVRETVKLGAGLGGGSVFDSYWMTFYDAACIHAALAKQSLGARDQPPAERQWLAQSDSERALDLLEKAWSTNEFKEMIRLNEVRRETLLDPLRTNRRFQRLMMDLAFPDNPFASERGSP
jgi:serine/threonine-protein kinase